MRSHEQTMTVLTDLLARVEAAEGPDRELFWELVVDLLPGGDQSRAATGRREVLAFADAGAWIDAALALARAGRRECGGLPHYRG